MSMMGGSSGAKTDIPGVTDIFSLLAFLDDKKARTKYLRELAEKTDALARERKVHGTVKQIEDLRQRAEKEAEKAKFLVDDAKEDARIIVLKAKKEAAIQQGFIDKKSEALKKREEAVKEAEKILLGKQLEFAEYSKEIATHLANAKQLEAKWKKDNLELSVTRAAMKRLVA